MDKNTVLDIVNDFKKAIEIKDIIVDQIILYGSYAKGTFNESSDIDLIVISNDFQRKNYWERIDILADAIYEVFKPIEAIAMTPEEWKNKENIAADIASDGEIIYAA